MEETASGTVLRFAGYALDVARSCLRGPDGAEIPLAPKPFNLLMVLARNAGRTLSKDTLLDAVWPGVHVTEDSLFQAVREARRAIGDEAGRVLRSVPRRGYLLDAPVTPEATVSVAEAPQAALVSPELTPPTDRPSLVVMPFANMSGDLEQEYFVDGLVEDITTALSRTRWLFVIARSSAFSYRGRAVDVREVGRDLGVRYVLQGSVRRARDDVRIGCQLIEAETGRNVWAERFDGSMSDVFALQDRVTEAVAGTVEPNLRFAEVARARRRPTGSLDAYDLYLRALALQDVFTRSTLAEVLDLCRKSISLDAGFTPAYWTAAYAYIGMFVQGWIGPTREEAAEALSLVERGLATDRNDAVMLALAGHVTAFFGHQLERGIAYLDEAVAANPYLLDPLRSSGLVRLRTGDTSVAIEHLVRAHRLSPRDPRRFTIFEGLARGYLLERQVEVAHDWAKLAVQQNANYLAAWRMLAATAGHLDRDEEARTAVQNILTISPGFSVSRYRNRVPIGAPEKWEFLFEGLRRAGLPAD